jgi:hypothetical protein
MLSGCIETKRRSALAPLAHCAADSADGCQSNVSGKLQQPQKNNAKTLDSG